MPRTIADKLSHKVLIIKGLIAGLFAVGFNWGVVKISPKVMEITGIITGSFAVGFNRRIGNVNIISGL